MTIKLNKRMTAALVLHGKLDYYASLCAEVRYRSKGVDFIYPQDTDELMHIPNRNYGFNWPDMDVYDLFNDLFSSEGL